MWQNRPPGAISRAGTNHAAQRKPLKIGQTYAAFSLPSRNRPELNRHFAGASAMDVLYLALIAGFSGLSFGLIYLCDKLGGSP
jgi:hypothetical protein